jgi:predicted dehydrogenase
MKYFDRRGFLKTAGAAAGVFYIAPTSWAQKSPGDTLNSVVVGFNGRGGSHIGALSGLKDSGVRLTALCDVDDAVLRKGVDAQDKKGVKVTPYTDIRKVLENKDIDIVSIATPNHWHSLGAIWAVQAGKDVYVEKPVSHNVWEGRQLVNAARKYKKIVQTGTQSRASRSGIGEAVKFVQSGQLGKVIAVRGTCYKPRGSIGKTDGAQPIPAGIDFDLWCGPAPKDEVRRKRLHYDWHWIWNYGNGDLGNQGIHQMDIARWFLGEMELSPRVWSVGGRLGYVDDGETPNTQVIYHDYAKAPLIFEVRGLPSKKDSKDMDSFMGSKIGVVVHCEGGHITVPSYTSSTAYDKEGKVIKTWKEEKGGGEAPHFKNFIEAVRSRNHKDLYADILEGHLSSALCHTGNISHRLGKRAAPGAIREQIKGDREATATVERMFEHLKANEVNIDTDKLTLGPVLKMNPKTETFIGNAAADKLLTRDYRKPFVVPAISA